MLAIDVKHGAPVGIASARLPFAKGIDFIDGLMRLTDMIKGLLPHRAAL